MATSPRQSVQRSGGASAVSPKGFVRYSAPADAVQSGSLRFLHAGHAPIRGEVLTAPESRRGAEFQLHYFPESGGIFETAASGPVNVSPGDCVVLHPGIEHRFTEAGSCTSRYWLAVSGPHVDELVAQGTLTPRDPVLSAGPGFELFEQLREIFAELELGDTDSMSVVSAQVILLLARLVAGPRGAEQRADRIIQNARCILRANVDRDVDLQELAAMLNTSYTWLRRSFRHRTGVSLHQYHLQLRLRKARELLALSGCTVREVAARTGFNDEFYFSRLFKLKTGCSPETLKPTTERRQPGSLSPFRVASVG